MLRLSLLVAVIVASASSAVIRCRFFDTNWNVVGRRYSCQVAEVQKHDVAEVTHVLGDHLPGRSKLDVEAFQLRGDVTGVENTLLTFPSNLGNYFPNLIFIDMHYNRLKSISSDDLAPWPNMTVLSVSNNRIESLEEELFRHSPKLVWLNFNNNLLRNVGVRLLSHLNGLTTARFDNNTCIDVRAENHQAMINLKVLLFLECPPLESCNARCSLNDEVDEHNRKLEKLQKVVENQVKQIEEQLKTIDSLQVKAPELPSNRCSCS